MCSRIDHTNLKPFATIEDILKLCAEVKTHKFRGVCVNPCQVKWAKTDLVGTNYKVSSVVGFPLGANKNEIKLLEAVRAVDDGADEIDVVWNLSLFKEQKYLATATELARIVRAVGRAHVKVIVEECYLTTTELSLAYSIVHDSGAHCIKTSTGMGKSGANLSTVKLWDGLRELGEAAAIYKDKKLMRDLEAGKSIFGLFARDLQIKAAGGIKTAELAQHFVQFGADVIGTSAGIAILQNSRERLDNDQ
jgi:deoxyribose-phosphate aldolase